MGNNKKQNTLEKITFYLGLIILSLLVGYLLFEYKTREDKPPNLKIITSFQPSMPYYTFKVETTNIGYETASSVIINFDLYQDGIMVENTSLTIDYAPRDSKKEGWVIFRKNHKPSDSLVISSISYLKP